MRRLVIALLTGSTMLGLGGAAWAADLGRPPPPPVYAPAPPPPFSWTGFYLGGNLGWGWTSGDGTLWNTFVGAIPISGDGNGVLGGIQAGYNWQTGPWVFGLETDFQGSGGDGDITTTSLAGATIGSFKTPWFGTIRGRLGYAFADSWMLYVTGGGLYGKADMDGSPPGIGSYSSSTTYWTWTLGGGVEAMLWDRWSAKLEYLYADTPNKLPAPPGTTAADGSMNNNIIRAGLNYHF
jgi:outer membrane immunogenic protein